MHFCFCKLFTGIFNLNEKVGEKIISTMRWIEPRSASNWQTVNNKLESLQFVQSDYCNTNFETSLIEKTLVVIHLLVPIE